MTEQDPIRDFAAACERFSMALNDERRFEARLTADSPESSFQRLLEMQTERCGIRNEIAALSPAAIALLNAKNRSDAALSLSRVVVASLNHLGRWHDAWFECKSHLANAAITPTEWNTVQLNQVRYSEFREPQEWRRLRKLKGLSHSRNVWQALLKKHSTDIDCESTKSARISFVLAQEWGLNLPEFSESATQ
jgi:hypothetical protein